VTAATLGNSVSTARVREPPLPSLACPDRQHTLEPGDSLQHVVGICVVPAVLGSICSVLPLLHSNPHEQACMSKDLGYQQTVTYS
jgi:hypothetical protein